MANEITVTIDGVEVRTQPGKMIIQAAMDAGIYIPYLCYYPTMKPFGACRMCVVKAEAKGPDGSYRPLPGTPASCTTPVADGMKVETNTPDVVNLRRGIMELLISEHPHGCLTCHRIELCGPNDICQRHVSVNDRCVTCPKNERCELKDTVRFLEMEMESPLRYNIRQLPLKVDDPYWEMDMNLCIVCARCVRACDEIRGDEAITLFQRSGKALIGTSQGTSLLESGCEFCGACIDVCPTGALVERKYKWDKAARTVNTICPHCPVGCEMRLEVDKRNRVIRTTPDIDAPANKGQFCFKGKFGLDYVNDRKRVLKRPLVRRDGQLQEVAWDEALDFAAEKLAQYRGGQYALIANPRGTNEDAYVAQKFARVVMGTNNVDLSSNLRPELTTPLAEVLGYPAATNTIWELDNARAFLVVGSNLTEEQTVVGVPIKRAVRNNGASLVVIDQRETELARYAKVWLRPKIGTEKVLIGGILRVVFDESLDDHQFVADSCSNLDELRKSLWAFDVVKVERITGVPQGEILRAARAFAARKPGAILYALETVAPELREDVVKALINLALVTGNVGRPSSGLYPLYLGTNEQGARDVGCAPDLLPGYRSVFSDRARQRFEREWGVEVPAEKGVSIREITAAIKDGRIKALHVLGDSVTFTSGEIGDFLEAVKGLEFLAVQDTFPGQLTGHAHVVFPSANFALRDGTLTNLERRVQLLRPAVGPKGEEEADWRTLSQIAQRMGAKGFDFQSSQAVFDEISSVVDLYGGISYERIERSRGVQWPCLAEDMAATPVLYANGFDPKKARLSEMKLTEPSVGKEAEYPLLLAWGRVLHQPERDAEIVTDDGRNRITRDEIIELHEQDARQLGIANGDWVEAVHARGSIRGVARLSGPQPGVVSVTTLFGGLITELEASPEPDPMVKVPRLPLLPVRVARAPVAAVAD